MAYLLSWVFGGAAADAACPTDAPTDPPTECLLALCQAQGGALLVLNAADGRRIHRVAVGERPGQVVVSHDGKMAFVARLPPLESAPDDSAPGQARSPGSVSIVDLVGGTEVVKLVTAPLGTDARIAPRDPCALALSGDGRFLFVAATLDARPAGYHGPRLQINTLDAQESQAAPASAASAGGVAVATAAFLDSVLGGGALERGDNYAADGAHDEKRAGGVASSGDHRAGAAAGWTSEPGSAPDGRYAAARMTWLEKSPRAAGGAAVLLIYDVQAAVTRQAMAGLPSAVPPQYILPLRTADRQAVRGVTHLAPTADGRRLLLRTVSGRLGVVDIITGIAALWPTGTGPLAACDLAKVPAAWDNGEAPPPAARDCREMTPRLLAVAEHGRIHVLRAPGTEFGPARVCALGPYRPGLGPLANVQAAADGSRLVALAPLSDCVVALERGPTADAAHQPGAAPTPNQDETHGAASSLARADGMACAVVGTAPTALTLLGDSRTAMVATRDSQWLWRVDLSSMRAEPHGHGDMPSADVRGLSTAAVPLTATRTERRPLRVVVVTDASACEAPPGNLRPVFGAADMLDRVHGPARLMRETQAARLGLALWAESLEARGGLPPLAPWSIAAVTRQSAGTQGVDAEIVAALQAADAPDVIVVSVPGYEPSAETRERLSTARTACLSLYLPPCQRVIRPCPLPWSGQPASVRTEPLGADQAHGQRAAYASWSTTMLDWARVAHNGARAAVVAGPWPCTADFDDAFAERFGTPACSASRVGAALGLVLEEAARGCSQSAQLVERLADCTVRVFCGAAGVCHYDNDGETNASRAATGSNSDRGISFLFIAPAALATSGSVSDASQDAHAATAPA